MVSGDLLDNGAPEVLVLRDTDATLDTDRLVLPGGGSADVFAEDDQTLVQVTAGHPDGVEILRSVLTSPALQVHGDVLDVVVVGGGGWDRWVLSGDLEHRWLFSRHWEHRPDTAAVVTVVGHSPGDDETTPRGAPTAGPALATATRLVHDTVGPPGTLHVVTLVTRRGGPVAGGVSDRRPDPGVVGAALDESDVVVASWGPVEQGMSDAVADTVEELRVRRDEGTRVLVRSVDGTIETSGTPPQPGNAPTVGRDTRLVDAPAEWLWGGELVS
ncbi:hypothetical protein [Salsipaludibacter albus]|uniref:hypothetical protein n=1 Tax=Salsipaludibacter albus TaxID=2849650 RepID=UPI001EE4AEE4|nr:hypothetical protein [Salsipaludibacter albus]MBY5162633.1 hypothetical protein [Salsipaludibacter albus]